MKALKKVFTFAAVAVCTLTAALFAGCSYDIYDDENKIQNQPNHYKATEYSDEADYSHGGCSCTATDFTGAKTLWQFPVTKGKMIIKYEAHVMYGKFKFVTFNALGDVYYVVYEYDRENGNETREITYEVPNGTYYMRVVGVDSTFVFSYSIVNNSLI